jgi:hypothetical protein
MTHMTLPASFPSSHTFGCRYWRLGTRMALHLALNLHQTIHVVDAFYEYEDWRMGSFSIDTSLQIVVRFVSF